MGLVYEDQLMGSVKIRTNSKKRSIKSLDHRLLGREVMYRGRFWRVVSAHQGGTSQGSPWLLIKRFPNISILVKRSEIKEVFN